MSDVRRSTKPFEGGIRESVAAEIERSAIRNICSLLVQGIYQGGVIFTA